MLIYKEKLKLAVLTATLLNRINKYRSTYTYPAPYSIRQNDFSIQYNRSLMGTILNGGYR